MLPASGRCDILRWIQSIGVNHEIPICKINLRSLGLVFAVEELRQSSLLDGVNRVVIKPSGITGNDNMVRLFRHIVFRLVAFATFTSFFTGVSLFPVLTAL